jgi:iron complex transport system permease protein
MRYYSPADVANVLWTAIYLGFGHLCNLPYVAQSDQIIDAVGCYHDVLGRAQIIAIVLVCGMLLAVSGMLFQMVFKNAIASPTMLGVSSGVKLGQIIAVLVFSSAIFKMPATIYALGYIGGLIALAIVLLIGKLTGGSGKGSFNLLNMMLIGAMFSEVIGIFLTFLSATALKGDLGKVYDQIVLTTSLNKTPLAIMVLVVTAIVTIIPLIARRYQLNLLAFSDTDIKLGGVNPSSIRILALACGSVMILAAQSEVGDVAMLSLVTPFLSRAIFGVEFRKQFIGSVLIGMIIILVCSDISAMIQFVSTGVPMTVIVNVLMVPLFAWIMATNQKALQ